MFLEVSKVFFVVNENTEFFFCAAGATGRGGLTDELCHRLGPVRDHDFLTRKKSTYELLQVSFCIGD